MGDVTNLLLAVQGNDERNIKGAGGIAFLIDSRTAVTATHVLVKGGWWDETLKQQIAEIKLTRVGMPNANPVRADILSALAEYDTSGRIKFETDIAVLRLSHEIEEDVCSYPWTDRADAIHTDVAAFGFTQTIADGDWGCGYTAGFDNRGLAVLNSESADLNAFIRVGFSGTPVLDAATRTEILGMIVSNRQIESRAYAIPAKALQFRLASVAGIQLPPLKNSIVRDIPHISELEKLAIESLKQDQLREEIFPFSLAPCQSFQTLVDVHRNAVDAAQRAASLTASKLTAPGQVRRLYIHAPGGFGKTTFLMSMTLAAIERGIVPYYFNLKNLTADALPTDKSLDMRSLFDRTSPWGGFEEFEQLSQDSGRPQKKPVIVLFDGLNETLSSFEDIIRVIDAYVQQHPGVSVCIADRMLARTKYPRASTLATLLPIDLNGVAFKGRPLLESLTEAVTPAFQRLLGWPFFLTLLLRHLRQGATHLHVERVEMLKAYFVSSLNTDEARRAGRKEFDSLDFRGLAALAFNAYETRSVGLQMPKQWWARELEAKGLEVFEKTLLGSGLIIESIDSSEGSRYEFRHELLHDFLVSCHLANQPIDELRAPVFDAATRDLRAPENLEFATELLQGREDDFIMQVYDWDYSAALTCVLNLEHGYTGTRSPVSPALREAIFALISEKKFDRFGHTRKRNESRIAQLESRVGISFQNAGSLKELVESVVENYPKLQGAQERIYRQWLELFRKWGDPEISDLPKLQDVPLLAWTAANAFRRKPLKEPAAEYVVNLLRASRASALNDQWALVTRWRLIHLLGVAQFDEVTELLREIITDGNEGRWVRYGACRSLLELASRCATADDARKIFDMIIQDIGKFADSTVELELTQAVEIAEAPPAWWSTEYRRVLLAGLDASGERLAAAERWRSALKQLG